MTKPALGEGRAGIQKWFWIIVAGAGAAIHLGTALLRLDTFFPQLRLQDFAAFYAGAWAIRQGISPYGWSDEFLEILELDSGLFVRPPLNNSSPPFVWLLQPATLLSFPVASVMWLLFLLALVGWTAVTLAKMARCNSWAEKVLAFILIATFGPVFLNLTLGQNSILILVAALLIGRAILVRRRGSYISASLAQVVAVGAKLFPLVWLGILPFLRRWRLFAVGVLVTVIAFGVIAALAPVASQDYWIRFLPDRASRFSAAGGLDDQSLTAWVDRLGRPHSFQVPGLVVTDRHTVEWVPPWDFDRATLAWVGRILTGLLAIIPLALSFYVGDSGRDGVFYLWVLYSLVVFPHTGRYNQVLVLPAMAWLWPQGGRGRGLAILGYSLIGLSRLNHLWAIVLPAPWGPLASGFGLYAILLLGAGIVVTLWPFRATDAGVTERISG